MNKQKEELVKERFKEKNKEYIKGFFEIFFGHILGAFLLIGIILFTMGISNLISQIPYLQNITSETSFFGFLLFISFFAVILIIYIIIENIRDNWKEAKQEIEDEQRKKQKN